MAGGNSQLSLGRKEAGGVLLQGEGGDRGLSLLYGLPVLEERLPVVSWSDAVLNYYLACRWQMESVLHRADLIGGETRELVSFVAGIDDEGDDGGDGCFSLTTGFSRKGAVAYVFRGKARQLSIGGGDFFVGRGVVKPLMVNAVRLPPVMPVTSIDPLFLYPDGMGQAGWDVFRSIVRGFGEGISKVGEGELRFAYRGMEHTARFRLEEFLNFLLIHAQASHRFDPGRFFRQPQYFNGEVLFPGGGWVDNSKVTLGMVAQALLRPAAVNTAQAINSLSGPLRDMVRICEKGFPRGQKHQVSQFAQFCWGWGSFPAELARKYADLNNTVATVLGADASTPSPVSRPGDKGEYDDWWGV